MKRAKITLWITLSIIFTLFIVSLILDNQSVFIIPFFIVLIGSLILRMVESKFISKKTNQYFEEGNYSNAIECLNNLFKKCFTLFNAYSCVITLVMSYMLEGDTDSAKHLIDKYKRIRKSKNLLYIQMIILVSENKLEEARQYQNKLLNLSSNKFNSQKKLSLKIFEMIETNKFDETIYNSTKYPLLRDVCLEYKNEQINNIQTIKSERLSIVQVNHNPKNKLIVKLFAIIINILTSLTLFVALTIVAIKSSTYDTISSIDGMYYSLKLLWVFWLFFPLSIGCLVFGIVFKKKQYKTKSNIIIGSIFSVLLFAYGSIHFLGLRQYKTDPEYLNNLGEIIQIDFPNEITIITQDWTIGQQTTSDGNYYKYLSVVRFTNSFEALNFNISMNDTYWIDSFFEETIEFLPMALIYEINNYDKFLLYCYESKEYNPKILDSSYNYVYIAYSKEYRGLIIYEFRLK